MNTTESPKFPQESASVEAVPETCCSVSEHERCCEPSAKGSCCGAAAPGQAGKVPSICGCR